MLRNIKSWISPLQSFLFFRADTSSVSESSPFVSSCCGNELESAAEDRAVQQEEERLQQLLLRAEETAVGVRQVSVVIRRASRDTEPLFLHLGTELQEIYGAAMGLTSAVQVAALHLSEGADGETCLDRARFLMDSARKSLNGEQQSIEESLVYVRELLIHLERFTTVCDGITRIGLWFRVVSVNIEIECNTQNLSGETFAGVSKDVNVLSREINEMMVDMKRNLDAAIHRLSDLAGSSTASLEKMYRLAEKAEGIVRTSYDNIQKMLAETEILIKTAIAHAQTIGEKVSEVVVSIQFHDSMSQRIEHIIEAMQDIENLCDISQKADAAQIMGTVHVILDFQKKQLLNLREEIRQLAFTTQNSLQTINGEICDMCAELAASKLTESKTHLREADADSFAPLQQGLRNLGSLLTSGSGMIDALHDSAEEITAVAEHLLKMIAGVKRIREDTHIKAINTIIMANNLGSQGVTIEVLAKEIRALADQTGEMVTEVTEVQEKIVAEVSSLGGAIIQERTTISPVELEQGVDELSEAYRQVQAEIGGVTDNTESLARRISGTAERLSFLDTLGAQLEEAIEQVERISDSLEPWKKSGQVHDENVLRLLERYTMEQERLVHAPVRVSQQVTGADAAFEFFGAEPAGAGTGETAVFDDNVELF